MALDRRYWDSDAFLGYLLNEPDKVDACDSVLAAAEDGKIIIVTSALTLAEVLYLKQKQKIPIESRTTVEDFFKNRFISVQNVTRTIAERARDVVWDYGIKPKDAIHVATALTINLPVINTFDKNLLSHNGKIGDPPIIIEHPHEQHQGKLSLD